MHRPEPDKVPLPPLPPLPQPLTPLQSVRLALKGTLMGTADVIPGVSGGTVALVLGIYARLLLAIRSITPRTLAELLRALAGARSPAGRARLVAAARTLHLDFLVPLGLGIAVAFKVAARYVPALMESHQAEMNGLFFGLIAVSAYVPFSKMPERALRHLLVAVVAAWVAFLLVGIPGSETPGGLGYTYLCGAVAVCAMILPGVSGSYMLKVMGQYEFVLTSFHEHDLAVLGVFVLGALTGLFTFARLVVWLLRRFESTTLAALTGLMVGSLRSVWPFREPLPSGRTANVLPSVLGTNELVVVGIAVCGAAVVAALILADRHYSRAA
jgi:putative membrane protein